MATRTLTVVFTDIKGFTARTSRASRASMLELLQKHEELLAPIVASHGGRVAKTIGDAFLLCFDSPTNAVLCGLRMQARLRSYNRDAVDDARIEIRVAINTGEVEVVNNDVFGETVNLASRIEGITDAGEVYFSEATHLAMNKAKVPTSQVGEFRLKGITEQVRVYRVVQDEDLELYKKVIASEPPAGAAKSAADMEAGALSESLVLASDQQQQIAPMRRSDPILWAAATVALLLVVGVGFLIVRGVQYRGNVQRIGQLASESQWGRAFELIAALRQQRPTDTDLVAQYESVATAEMQDLIAAGRFERAAERLATYTDQYPDLGALDALDRQLRLEEATALYHSQRSVDVDAAELLMEGLLEEYPNDLEIRSRFARNLAFNAVSPSPVRALFLAREIVEAEPGTFRADPEIERIVAGSLSHTDLQRRYPELLDFVVRRYGAVAGAIAIEGIDDEDAELRANSRAILSRGGALTSELEFRFYLAELLAYDLGTFAAYRDETLDYFEQFFAAGVPADHLALVPSDAPLPPTLRNRREPGDRAEQVVGTLFVEQFIGQLQVAASAADGNVTLRERASRILQARAR